MAEPITEFIGVYDADSTILGEIGYWLGARFGVRHCSLCDITHGLFTERNDWKRCRESMSVPIITYHRNDAPNEVLNVVNGVFPCVIARSSSQISIVLGPQELELLDGSPEALVSRLNELVV
jgi:hypothetical protein